MRRGAVLRRPRQALSRRAIMKFLARLEAVYAAIAFAEQNQSETALDVAGARKMERKKETARPRKRADARPRLRV